MVPIRSLAIATIAIGFYWAFIRSDFKPEEAIGGRSVVVTGASSGIGEQLAYKYAKLRANILITARRDKQLQLVADKCLQLGASKVKVVVADMTKAEDRTKLIEQMVKHFDGGLDYLILNHAIFNVGWWHGSPSDFAYLQRATETNYLSYVDLASRSLDLLKAKRGHIGVVSAAIDQTGFPLLGPHAATKAALYAFFSSWRQELRYRQVDVSITLCILGLVDTEAAMKQVPNTIIPADLLAFTADRVADVVLESVALKSYVVHYPKYIQLLYNLHQLFTETVENAIGYAVLSNVTFSEPV